MSLKIAFLISPTLGMALLIYYFFMRRRIVHQQIIRRLHT